MPFTGFIAPGTKKHASWLDRGQCDAACRSRAVTAILLLPPDPFHTAAFVASSRSGTEIKLFALVNSGETSRLFHVLDSPPFTTEVTAALLESLVQIHPFVDGNKPTAFAVVDVFLRINGHTITAGSEAVYDKFIKLLDQGTFDMEHLVPWLERIAEST